MTPTKALIAELLATRLFISLPPKGLNAICRAEKGPRETVSKSEIRSERPRPPHRGEVLRTRPIFDLGGRGGTYG